VKRVPVDSGECYADVVAEDVNHLGQRDRIGVLRRVGKLAIIREGVTPQPWLRPFLYTSTFSRTDFRCQFASAQSLGAGD
jgi:hypothetical protein